MNSAPVAPTEVAEEHAPIAVVGIGASAGGLEALETFFAHMPHDAGLAYVVVQHLSPDFKSLMDELLGRYTRMTVRRVEDGMAVEPNSVYVIPPGKEMIISSGKLLLRDKEPHTALALPIDMFFRSLAGELRQRAIAVVLSGTGSDGSRGLREVHEAGGLVMVQSPELAKFDGMPRSAIETGLVDLVLPVEEMAPAVVKYLDHARLKEGDVTAREQPLQPEQHIERIVELLHSEYNIDFRHYKPNTLRRRIERRLLLNRTVDLESYVRQVEEDRGELHQLYKDLLIGVTRFFRDRDAFARLEAEVLPQLLARRPADEEIRVWVAGCATGEEAYSIAILIQEQLDKYKRHDAVKIFATDVHRASLEVAAAGLYDESLLAEVSAERRDKYFRLAKPGCYQVAPEVRKLVVFAPHDVLKDAPFTRLDLVTCRNLLIYFDPLAQKKVLSLFHFALRAGGLLFMGPSETPGELQNEFDSIDRHWKIFRKKRDVRLPPDFRMPPGAHLLPVRAPRGRTGIDANGDSGLKRAQDALVSSFVPPSILVDEHHEVMHTFSGGGRYLTQPADGRASLKVLDLVETELKLTLNGALHRAGKESKAVTYSGVRLATPEGSRKHRVTVRPLEQPGESWFVITLELEEAQTPELPESAGVNLDEMSRERMASLERELQHTRENLQATLEEMETANEELQATNEELVASNEELQSTNEELHSVNEELYTVNSEHQSKIRELTELTEDMENLFAATDVGIIFLDTDLCVRKFTPQIERTFHLLPQDIGRRIDTFAHSLNYPELIDRLHWVLKSEQRFETQVEDRRGTWYLLRVVPYRVGSGVRGVLVNLVDITGIKDTELRLARMSKVFQEGADPIVIEDLAGRVTEVNEEAVRAYGWKRDELVGQNVDILIPAAQRPGYAAARAECQVKGHVRNVETARADRRGQWHPALVTMSLLVDDRGAPMGVASIAKDISRQKQAEGDAHMAVKRRDEFLAMLSHELRNPLAAAQSACAALLDKQSAPQQLARAAGIVHRQVGHMARLLEDLLDVSRVVQGKISIQSEPIDLARTTMEAVESLQGLINSREQRLTIEVDPAPSVVIGDRARLRQIQENLLSNASKFTPRGGSIDLTLRREGDEVVVRVRDSGRGIANDMQNAIFELFTQVEGPIDRSDGGMGIGLTMVRHLVHLHGGRVAVRSEGPGRGSEFEVRLPAATATPAQASDGTTPSREAAAPQAAQRVLVIEDNADAREALAMVLELEGFAVTCEPDGERGLSTLVDDPPNVALVDIGLPGLNGFDVAKRARERLGRDRVRLVALTGYGSQDDRRKVREAGFDAHLVKPVTREALRRVLDGKN